MQDFVVISVACEPPDKVMYKQCAERLKSDLVCAKIDNHYIKQQVVDSTEDKRSITLNKPSFILDCLLYFKKTVVWVDVDSLIHKKFYLSDGKWDVGVVSHPDYQTKKKSNWTTNGIHAWRYTDGALKVLRAWVYLCQWRDLCDYDDHARLEAVRYLMKDREYKEISIHSYVKGCITINPDTEKEDTLER